MIKELEEVILNIDKPELNLKKGDIGTVVMILDGGKGYEVEFNTLDGQTLYVETLYANEIRKVKKSEIAHVRKLTSSSNSNIR